MTFVRLLVAMLAAALVVGGVAVETASAQTADDCQAQLAQLRADTIAASSSFTNEKSVTSLVGKLDAASAKLAQGKNADAVQKLVDFQTTLNALAAAGKVDATTAQTLNAEAQGVIDCINSIDSTA
jgi:FIMAH domain